MPVNATDAYVARAGNRATVRAREAEQVQASESSSRNEAKTSAERAVDASTSARTERTKRVEARPDTGRSELPEKRTNDGPANGNGQSNSILDANRGRNVNISA